MNASVRGIRRFLERPQEAAFMTRENLSGLLPE
jgi:hypothetical protein